MEEREGETFERGRKKRKDRFFSPRIFISFVLSFSRLWCSSLSLSMYIDAYIYVHPLRYFFVQFWFRVDWYRSGESDISIYISWDSRAFWSMESFGVVSSGDRLIFARWRRKDLLDCYPWFCSLSIAFRFETRGSTHGGWTNATPPSPAKTDIYGTIVYPAERNSDKMYRY